MGLIVLGRVKGELTEELTLFGHDPHISVGHQQQDPTTGVGSSDADVSQPAPLAQRHPT